MQLKTLIQKLIDLELDYADLEVRVKGDVEGSGNVDLMLVDVNVYSGSRGDAVILEAG